MEKQEYFKKIADIDDQIAKLQNRRDKLIDSAFKEHNYQNMTMFNFEYIQWRRHIDARCEEIVQAYKRLKEVEHGY